ncbi:hypothetical protein M885DRAFT_289992 [Pelagophyceae sp. CCMP2097]|nr:hypothetical protein M885DRAFT_289992 [Pelagophyceae sp. CCMP2097]|mmetsp:Transcript_32429/g.114091  ORF Transcript_32429/g.114091 Transcript_32429/m.114091 type:complete len:220 (+) Transcript_32429:66-725(+)
MFGPFSKSDFSTDVSSGLPCNLAVGKVFLRDFGSFGSTARPLQKCSLVASGAPLGPLGSARPVVPTVLAIFGAPGLARDWIPLGQRCTIQPGPGPLRPRQKPHPPCRGPKGNVVRLCGLGLSQIARGRRKGSPKGTRVFGSPSFKRAVGNGPVQKGRSRQSKGPFPISRGAFKGPFPMGLSLDRRPSPRGAATRRGEGASFGICPAHVCTRWKPFWKPV